MTECDRPCENEDKSNPDNDPYLWNTQWCAECPYRSLLEAIFGANKEKEEDEEAIE